MVSSDQIIATLGQPLCVVRKRDQVIMHKNQAFTQLVPNVNNQKFGDIFKLFSDKMYKKKKLYSDLNEMSTTLVPMYVQSTQGIFTYVHCIFKLY